MNYDQLSPALKRRVNAQDATTTRSKPSRTVTEAGLPLRCHSCGFVAHPATEGRLAKHQAENPGHGRWEYRP